MKKENKNENQLVVKDNGLNVYSVFNTLTQLKIFSKVIFRDALPNISSGIRISISLAFVLVVVTEMFLSANNGLGKMIYDVYLQYRIPEMYALILILGFVGFSFNKLYILLESKYLFWNK